MPSFRHFVPPASVDEALADLKRKPASYWMRRGEKKVLELFDYAHRTVPAYKKFLKAHGVDGNRIKTIEDFKTLPVMDKETYLRTYQYRDLFPNRDLSRVTTISATSGSTGEPFYFPRGEEQDAQYEYIAELFLKNQFEIDKKSTLGIIGFGLGIWIGGIFTYKVMNRIAAKGYRLSLLPIGPNKQLYLRSLKKFCGMYDQVLLMGLPPFIKDIIDEGKDEGIRWQDYRVRILTATETFSEDFRDYLAAHARIKNPYTDIINIYGTVEMGTMAYETGITTWIRKTALRDTQIFSAVFPGSTRLPTLAQYHPDVCHFEEAHGEVLASGFGSALPLLRYRFPDKGGVVSFDAMEAALRKRGIDVGKETRRIGIAPSVLRLPFVCVYERSDFSTTLFGITIYTEYIRAALHNGTSGAATGKFTMRTCNDAKQNQFLELNVELKKKVRADARLSAAIEQSVVDTLLARSTEYSYLYRGSAAAYQKRLRPRIKLWSYEHETYFRPGGKQKWVKR